MSGEVSYFSRFFAKFVEILGAGLASAVCACLLAHFGGRLLSSPMPTSAPILSAVQVASTVGEVAKSLPAQPTAPLAAPAVNEQRAAQQHDIPVAQPASTAVKDSKALPPRKHTKTDTTVAEKKSPGHKSAEALARAALANVDANWPAPANALIGPGLTDARSAPIDVQPRQADVSPRQPDVRLRPLDVPPRADAIEAVPNAAHVQPRLVQPRPAPSLQPSNPDVKFGPATPVDIQSRPVAGVEPRSPSAAPPLEIAASQAPPPGDQERGVFSALKRIPDMLRPDPPAPTGEAPRPPMPIGTQ